MAPLVLFPESKIVGVGKGAGRGGGEEGPDFEFPVLVYFRSRIFEGGGVERRN